MSSTFRCPKYTMINCDYFQSWNTSAEPLGDDMKAYLFILDKPKSNQQINCEIIINQNFGFPVSFLTFIIIHNIKDITHVPQIRVHFTYFTCPGALAGQFENASPRRPFYTRLRLNPFASLLSYVSYSPPAYTTQRFHR